MIDDPINRSRSCEDTSFFEVLDEVNSSIALPSDKFVVGANKRVQIIANPCGSGNNRSSVDVSTPAAPARQSNSQNKRVPASRQLTELDSNHADFASDRNLVANTERTHESSSKTRPQSMSLKVANSQTPHDQESFYVILHSHQTKTKKKLSSMSVKFLMSTLH